MIAMVAVLKVSDEAFAKVELFAKDNDVSKYEAASKIILQNADLLAAQVILENSNCHWDLFKFHEQTGEKDFSCPIKRQRPDLRAAEKMDTLNENFCGKCPMMKLVKEQFKFEVHLKTLERNPLPVIKSEAPTQIKEELAKDTVEPEPQERPNPLLKTPMKATYRIQCDSCSFAIYNDSSADEAADELTDHVKKEHARDLTRNELNQLKILNRSILSSLVKEGAN
jgi:predicted small metal-binding protein